MRDMTDRKWAIVIVGGKVSTDLHYCCGFSNTNYEPIVSLDYQDAKKFDTLEGTDGLYAWGKAYLPMVAWGVITVPWKNGPDA